MQDFTISPVSKALDEQLRHKINTKTKPIGALGQLEEVALRIGRIQKTLTPELQKPAIIVCAGDHGITEEKISPFPQEVTYQMVMNFLGGGAAINVFTRHNKIELFIADAGVNYEFKYNNQLIDAKIQKGTNNFAQGAAMSVNQCWKTIENGAKIVNQLHSQGTNIIGFGEMGIGNTTSASALLCAYTGCPAATATGKGTGLSQDGIIHKTAVIEAALKLNGNHKNGIETLATYGGFEIAMITGGILQAANLGMTIMIDGFIVTSALLAAHSINPHVLDYCIFTHQSNEQAHKFMLRYLNAQPLLNIDMRLGEGTGVAVAFPLIQSAINFLNEMSSFENAGVSKL